MVLLSSGKVYGNVRAVAARLCRPEKDHLMKRRQTKKATMASAPTQENMVAKMIGTCLSLSFQGLDRDVMLKGTWKI